MERVVKFFPAQVKAYNKTDLTVDHFISTEEEDRSGDTVYADGIEFDAQPMVLKNHGQDPDIGAEPIARCESWRVAVVDGKKGLLVRTRYYDGSHLVPPDNTGRRLFEKAIGGYMPYWSIGFIVKKSEPKPAGRGRHLLNTVVYEYSQVGVPDNPTATVLKTFAPEQARPEDVLRFEPETSAAAVDKSGGGDDDEPAATVSAPESASAALETKPKPREGESRDEYLQRCIPVLIEEGKPQDQAVAICNAMWEEQRRSGQKSFRSAVAGRAGLVALQVGMDVFTNELLYETPDERALRALLKEFQTYVEIHARAAWGELQALRATEQGKALTPEEIKARLLHVASQSSATAAPGVAAGEPALAAPAPPQAAVTTKSPVVLLLRKKLRQEPQILPCSREQIAQAVRQQMHNSTRCEMRRMLGRVE